MKTKHTKLIASKCPVDDSVDIYKLIIITNHLIKVEDIASAVSICTINPIFQEDLTFMLSTRLKCYVKLIGKHSGFKTITEWGEP